jgi:GTP-binding protein
LNREFLIIDTGGFSDAKDPMQTQIRQQVNFAVLEADVIIMVIDGRAPLTVSDYQVAEMLRKVQKRVVLAVNKIEDFKTTIIDPEMYRLGLGEPVLISAEHGMNIGDLLDQVLAFIPHEEVSEDPDLIRVAFVGRPNVGKSSLINALLGEKRVIVSDQPGTTRDAIDTPFFLNQNKYLLVDTAGIRRKSKVDESVEYYSVLRALRAVERTDVAILVLDATSDLAEQDLKVAGVIKEAQKACIIAINKWDLCDNSSEILSEKIRQNLQFIDYAPLLFISAKTGERLTKLMPLVDQVMANYTLRLSTNRLNHVVSEALALHNPPPYQGRAFKIYFTSQIKVKPPTFTLTVNEPEGLHFSYRRYLENRFRENFGFLGTPIRFELRTSRNKANY